MAENLSVLQPEFKQNVMSLRYSRSLSEIQGVRKPSEAFFFFFFDQTERSLAFRKQVTVKQRDDAPPPTMGVELPVPSRNFFFAAVAEIVDSQRLRGAIWDTAARMVVEAVISIADYSGGRWTRPAAGTSSGA